MEVVGLAAAVISIAKTAKTIAHFADQLYDAAKNAPRIRDHISKSALSLRSFSTTTQTAQLALKHRFPNDPDSPVVRYMVNYNLMGDLQQESRSLRERIRKVEGGVSRVWSKFDMLTSWRWSRVKPSIDELTVPMESLKNSLTLIVNVIVLECLSSDGTTRSAEELEREIVFLKRIIRSQIETIRQLREDHHYIPIISESPEAAVADPQLRLCHLASSMAETETAPESSPETFRFSKPRRRRSDMYENGHSSAGRRQSQRLSEIPRSPRVQFEEDGPSASRPLEKSSRRESRHSVPASVAKEAEKQAVPAEILALAALAPGTVRRVSKFESLPDKEDETPSEAVEILPQESPVQEGSIKSLHVIGEIKPPLEKRSVRSVEAPTPDAQPIFEHREPEKEPEEESEDHRAEVLVAEHSSVNEDSAINSRWATKAKAGNPNNQKVEKVVVEEHSDHAAEPLDTIVVQDGPPAEGRLVQDGTTIHHLEERRPSDLSLPNQYSLGEVNADAGKVPNQYSLGEVTPAAEKVLARERSVKTGISKERPVINGAAEEWRAKAKSWGNRRQSTIDGRSERRSVEKVLPEERRSLSDRKLVQEETSSRRSINAQTVEGRPVGRVPSETEGRPAGEIATDAKTARHGPAVLEEESASRMREDKGSSHSQPARDKRTKRRSSDKRLADEIQPSPEQLAQQRLVPGHLGNESSMRAIRRNGVKDGDKMRGYINIGSLQHQEAVAHVDRAIRKNLISRAFANELQLEIQGKPGVLFYGKESMSSDGAVTFSWGHEEVTCHVIDKLKKPLVFGRDFLTAERKGI